MKHDYELIIVGAGTAGVVAAVYSRAMYKKVMLVENVLPGGKNFYKYTYPLNAFISVGRKISAVSSLENLGVTSGRMVFDPGKLRERIQGVITKIAEGVSPEVFRKMGIDYISGTASFSGKDSITVDGKEYTSRKFLLSTGMEHIMPEIKGLQRADCLFPEDIVYLSSIPESVLIIGAGESGLEIATALAGCGSAVILIEKNDSILINEDTEIAAMLEKNLSDRKIRLVKSARMAEVIKKRSGFEISYVQSGEEHKCEVQKIICCTGRKPDFSALNTEAAGIQHDESRVFTDKFLRTSNRNVYAAGDITGGMNYNNTAEIEGLTAVINSGHFFKKNVNYNIIPRCLNCDMEFARFGYDEKEAVKKFGNGIRVFKFPLHYSIKASVENMNDGIAKIICRRNSRIVGAQIYSDSASELVHQLLLLVRLKKKFSEISHVSHSFPSHSDILRQPSKRCYLEEKLDNVFVNIFHGLTGKKLK